MNVNNLFPFINLDDKNARYFLLSIVLGFLLPLLLLIGFGAYQLWQLDMMWLWLIVGLVGAGITYWRYWLIKRQLTASLLNELSEETSDQGWVSANPSWSDKEEKIWRSLNASIVKQLEKDEQWEALQDHAMDIFTETAQGFEKQAFEFTITEVLVLLEEVSRRYRLVLSEHLPHTLLSNITFYHVKRIHELHRDYGDTAKTTLKTGFWVFRSIRLMLNPVNAIIAETKGKIQGAITEELGDKLIFNLKRALLQEVASVCIDLYSGRFTTQTPQTSRVSLQDEARLVHHLEPLRVVIVGQISSGKSSLVNALLQDTLAEVDLLPSTDRITAYQLGIEGEASLRLIDMKGLSHDNQVLDETLSEITQADLVIWVLKANQSARSLDTQLKEKIEQFYQAKENISRKQPTLIGVLTHIDQLLPKVQQTSYQLSPPVTEKEKTIIEAMNYNQQLLRFSTIIPMAVQQPNSAFGVDTLTEEIAKCYATAKQTQLNRQRHDLTQQEISWLDEGKRLFKGLGQIVKRSVISS